MLPLADEADAPLRERPGHPGVDLHGRPAICAQALVVLPDGRKLVAQVDGGSGHASGRSREIHIGLGKVDPAERNSTCGSTGATSTARCSTPRLKLAPGWHTVLLGKPAPHQCWRATERRNCPMKTPSFNTTVLFYPNKNPKLRLFALWYFTVLMIVWNILGHTYLGFEQSHAATFVGVGTAILCSFFSNGWMPRAKNRELRFAGGWGNFLNFLPAALIPGFACAMLLYPTNGYGRLYLPSPFPSARKC